MTHEGKRYGWEDESFLGEFERHKGWGLGWADEVEWLVLVWWQRLA